MADTPEVQITDPSSQPYQATIFINKCNGYLGSQLVETFRNDHVIELNPNIIVGTCDANEKTPPPDGVQVVKYQERTVYNTAILNADVIVFQLQEGTYQEFQYLIRLSKYLVSEKQKTIICVSSFSNWSQSTVKEVKDIASREGAGDYLRELQNLSLDAEKQNPSVKSYLVYKGIVYGRGEGLLFPFFKSSIVDSESGLPVLSSGENTVPTIHVQDLCSIIEYISNNKPQQTQWLVSDGTNPTQLDIIKTIANDLGKSIVNVRNFYEHPQDQIPRQLRLNIKVPKTKAPIEWHCQGLVNNIGSIISEFNQYRGIKTNKIYVGGMPVAGKTHIAQILSKHYNLPLLNVKETVQQVKNSQTELGQRISKILEETRVRMVQQELKLFQEAKKKKKPKKGQSVEEFDPSKVVPRLSQQNLILVFRERMSQQDCKNRGYVLDGFPKTALQASELFKDNEGSLPNSSFYIESTQEEIKERVKKLPLEISNDTHWNEEGTLRRLGAHKTHLDGNKNILEFFNINNVEIRRIPFNAVEPKQELISFVQRNGPMGLTPTDPLPVPLRVQQVQHKDEPQQPTQNNYQDTIQIQKLKQSQKKILDEKSKPIRQYLIDNVIPQLTQGLIQVCRQSPQDPLNFLISFLEQKQKTPDSV